jgi:hypothetical protein
LVHHEDPSAAKPQPNTGIFRAKLAKIAKLRD